MRFPRQWQAYENQQQQVPDGTPLPILFPQDPQLCDQMRALRVHTIEHLAGLTEEGIKRMGMGGRAYVQKAKDFLEAAQNMKGAHEMQRTIEAQADEIATLKAAVEQLKARIAEQPKGRRGAAQQEEFAQ